MKVVTVASHVPEEPHYKYREFVASVERFGAPPVVLGMGGPWRGLMTKPHMLREWLRAGNAKGERIIVCDAFDILFACSPESVDEYCRYAYRDAIVFNGEKACWPRADLTSVFDEKYGVFRPWRFLNSGFMCGPADAILALVEAMGIESIGFDPVGGPYPNDQGEYQVLFAKQPVPMEVDTSCRAAQCLSGCTLDEFDFTGPYIQNVENGAYPGVFHCNGGAKEIFQSALLSHQSISARTSS